MRFFVLIVLTSALLLGCKSHATMEGRSVEIKTAHDTCYVHTYHRDTLTIDRVRVDSGRVRLQVVRAMATTTTKNRATEGRILRDTVLRYVEYEPPAGGKKIVSGFKAWLQVCTICSFGFLLGVFGLKILKKRG